MLRLYASVVGAAVGLAVGRVVVGCAAYEGWGALSTRSSATTTREPTLGGDIISIWQ